MPSESANKSNSSNARATSVVITESQVNGKIIKLTTAWSFEIQSYTGKKEKQSDGFKILELESTFYNINQMEWAGNKQITDCKLVWTSKSVTCIEHIGDETEERSMILREDHQGKLTMLVINSAHILYCQVLFYCAQTETSLLLKIYNLVTPSDHLPFDSKGKTSLWIDDAAFSKDDKFMVFAFKYKSIGIMTWLGSFIRIVNPTLVYVENMM